MNITKEWLLEQNACNKVMEWFNNQTESDCIAVLKKLLSENRLDWFTWLAVRVMTHEQKVRWAIECADLALPLFETKYPLDQRPRTAILAAREWLRDPTPKSKAAVKAAAYAAVKAAAYAAYTAARAAADATYTAAYAAKAAAYAAAYAADASAYAACAVDAACASDAAARKQMQQRCADIAIEIISVKLIYEKT